MIFLKLILGLFFIPVIAFGSFMFGWGGFAFTFIIAFVISSLINRVEKGMKEKAKHKELLAAIEKAGGKNA